MNTLPPLPLVNDKDGNPCLLIDNSTLELLQACPRAFEYSFLRKRVSANDKPAQNFGAGVHEALAHRYKMCGGKSPDVVTAEPGISVAQEMESLLWEHFNTNPQPEADFRTLSLAKDLITEYNHTYQNESWDVAEHDGKKMVEVSFAHEVGVVGMNDRHPAYPISNLPPIKIIFTGRMDLVIKDAYGLWVLDHKTASRYGEEFWNDQRMLWQCKGYVWAYWKSYGEKPLGYFIDAIRLGRPTKKDEFDVAMQRPFKRDDFKRDCFLVSEEQLKEWQTNILLLCEEALFWYSKGIYPRKTKWCQGKYGRCQYCDVCMLGEDQRIPTLLGEGYQDNTWSPLNKPVK